MLENKLNALLANYEVMYHKLQTYHWYVGGDTFFSDHEKLEQFYDQAALAVDTIAEKILMMGGKPLGNMQDMLKAATIKEAKEGEITQEKAFQSVRDDFAVLLEDVKEIKRAAEKDENFLIGIMADDLIVELSKNLWMLGQVLA